MVQRKLKALDYLEWDKVNINNPQHFRKVVVWLEDQKIRHYKIDERKQLRDTNNGNWPSVFQKYCADVQCPQMNTPLGQLEWLLGHAVWLEHGESCEKYKNIMEEKKSKMNITAAPSIKSTNPLDNLDFDSAAFKEGTNTLAKLLNVPRHPDHLVTLRSCSKLVSSRLNSQSVQNSSSRIAKEKPFPVMDIAPGFNLGDVGLENAAKGLSLLYIQDLRELQTRINETIVAVQSITANPKTDTKLGKVGK